MYETLIKPAVLDFKNFVLDTLFPIHCLSCGTEGNFICVDCKPLLTKLEKQLCINCQKPSPFGLTHPGCLTPHSADGLISFYNYHDDKVAKIIIHGKYFFLKDVYKNLAYDIAQGLVKEYPNILISNLLLIPIPLHPSRHKWRGFNQAQILCEALSKELDLPVADILHRQKITKTQKDLKREERLKNVDGAFALSAKILDPKSYILNNSFILVDDVTTTGATLKEAVKVLKRNGAEKVFCLTIARD